MGCTRGRATALVCARDLHHEELVLGLERETQSYDERVGQGPHHAALCLGVLNLFSAHHLGLEENLHGVNLVFAANNPHQEHLTEGTLACNGALGSAHTIV